jgi:tRNA modification GTPase
MILVINKIDRAPIDSVGPFEEICSRFFKKVVRTCAVTGEGIPELEKAVLDVRGLEPISSAGRKWTVNQVSPHVCCYI